MHTPITLIILCLTLFPAAAIAQPKYAVELEVESKAVELVQSLDSLSQTEFLDARDRATTALPNNGKRVPRSRAIRLNSVFSDRSKPPIALKLSLFPDVVCVAPKRYTKDWPSGSWTWHGDCQGLGNQSRLTLRISGETSRVIFGQIEIGGVPYEIRPTDPEFTNYVIYEVDTSPIVGEKRFM